jgi:hypothetical protein
MTGVSSTTIHREEKVDKCCCGFEHKKPEPPPKKKEHVNHIQTQNSAYCCGMVELGNFNYVDPPDGKKMVHYHKVGGSWQVQRDNDYTTKEDVKRAMEVPGAGFIATTGAGQEYMDPILAELGFKHVSTFINPGHAGTPVKLWVFSRHMVDAKPEEKKSES